MFVAVSWAQSSQERFSQSIELYKTSEFQRSRALLVTLLKDEPDNALYWFNLANAHFKLESYTEALTAYEKVVALKSPLAQASRLYSAKTLRRLNRQKQAEEILTSLLREKLTPALKIQVQQELSDLRSPGLGEEEMSWSHYQAGHYHKALKTLTRSEPSENSQLLKSLILLRLGRATEAQALAEKLSAQAKDPDVRGAARDILEQARSEEPGRFSFFGEASAGSDSNVTLSARNPQTQTVTRLFLNSEVTLARSDSASVSAAYLFGWDEVASARELRVMSHTFQVPLQLKTRAVEWSAQPYLQYEFWETELVLFEAGVHGQILVPQDTRDFGLDLDFSKQTAQDLAYDYLNGTSFRMRFFYGVRFYPWYVQPYLTASKHNSRDLLYTDGSLLPLSYQGLGAGLRVLWRMSPLWSLQTSLSHLQKTYESPSRPGAKMRIDQELLARLRLSYRLSPRTSAFALGEHYQNASTLGPADVTDKNIRGTTLLLGLNWAL